MSSHRSSKHISHKQIAEILQISRATVSNVLSGREDLPYRQETRDKIIQTAQELGYQPNRASTILRKGRSNLIGVVHFGGGSSGGKSTAMLLPKAINEQGFDYLVLDFRWLAGGMERMVNEMIQSRVEGVIVSHMQGVFGPRYVEMFRQVGIPVVTIYGSDRLGVPLFCDDVPSVFEALTRHLVGVGHRDLALVVYDNGSRTPTERVEGFRRVLDLQGGVEEMDEESFLSRHPTVRPRHEGLAKGTVVFLKNAKRPTQVIESSFCFAQRLFARGGLPHAILASNDESAYGYFHAALHAGVRIPQDVALTGFDNRLQSRYPLFNLTTAQTDVEAACSAVAKALASYIRGEISEIAPARFDSQLIMRGSCGRRVVEGVPEIVVNLAAQPTPSL